MNKKFLVAALVFLFGRLLLRNQKISLAGLIKEFREQPAKKSFLLLLFLWSLYNVFKSQGWLSKKRIRGQHVFVTGGGMGIGKQMALLLAKQGCRISIADINLEAAESVVREISQIPGAQAAAYKADISQSEQVYRIAHECVERFGDVDILINNAGIISGKKITELTDRQIDSTIAVNLTSHHYTVRAFLPRMLERNQGHIVSIASMAGHIGVAGMVDYTASKFGAVGFDESLRQEIRIRGKSQHVRTTCICPYYINTGMFAGISTKFGFILPILEEKFVAWRVITAILQNEEFVALPWACNIAIALKGLLPVTLYDFLKELAGLNKGMETFRGRVAPLPSQQ